MTRRRGGVNGAGERLFRAPCLRSQNLRDLAVDEERPRSQLRAVCGFDEALCGLDLQLSQ